MKKLSLVLIGISALASTAVFADGGMVGEQVVCFAFNGMGNRFAAVDVVESEAEAQQRALDKCSRSGALVCRPAGCHALNDCVIW